VRDTDGEHVCWLPCNLELDEHEAVSIVRADGRTRFLLRQEDLGEGAFSASIRAHKKPTKGALAGRVFAAALSGAASVLTESDDKRQVAAGVLLSGMGAAARIASEGTEHDRDELWVQRTATR
jgi:hypothetical protein